MMNRNAANKIVIEELYDSIIKSLKSDSDNISDELRIELIALFEKITYAIGPVSKENKQLIEKFRDDIVML